MEILASSCNTKQKTMRMRTWLKGHVDFTSPKIQNEILMCMGNSIVREIVSEINSLPVVQFSLMGPRTLQELNKNPSAFDM